ncbi:MAG: ABC transporter ATP-binding protein [Bacilli bacterium]
MKIDLCSLSLSYPEKKGEEKKALDSLSLSIPDGSLFGLLGPSGCGKTTTLNLIAGLLKPEDGKILFNGKDASSLPPEERGIGYVPQDPLLYPHMSIYQNIAFVLSPLILEAKKKDVLLSDVSLLLFLLKGPLPATAEGETRKKKELFLARTYSLSLKGSSFLLGLMEKAKKKDLKQCTAEAVLLLEKKKKAEEESLSKKGISLSPDFFYRSKDGSYVMEKRKLTAEEIDKRIIKAAKDTDILPLLKRRPGELSGGERQRASLARALAKSPKVLLLDEPLSHLDQRLRLEMRETIRDIQKKTRITMVYVTHDQEEAIAICDFFALLNNGKLVQEGVPQEVYSDPSSLFTAKFLGPYPANVFQAEIRRGRLLVGEEEILERVPLQDQDVLFALRPNALFGKGSCYLTLAVEEEKKQGAKIVLQGKDNRLLSPFFTFLLPSSCPLPLGENKVSFSSEEILLFDREKETRIRF